MIRVPRLSRKKLYLIALLSACPPVSAQQQPVVGRGPYVEPQNARECQENALALSRCEAIRAEHSGKYLEELIEEVTAALSLPSLVPSFEKANEAWVNFRNASCEFDSEGAGGSSRAYRSRACTHSYNKSRIALLERYLRCLRGGCDNDVHLYHLVSPQR
jgi:hypothetical protein